VVNHQREGVAEELGQGTEREKGLEEVVLVAVE
jgi:hypothetical protein